MLRSRLLVRVLVLLLAPLLVVTLPSVSTAATEYGTPGSASFDNGKGGFLNVSCNTTGYWVVPDAGSPTVRVKGHCNIGWGGEMNGAYLQAVTLNGPDGCGDLLMDIDVDPEEPWSFDLGASVGGEACLITTGSVAVCGVMWGGGQDNDACINMTAPWVIEPPEDPNVNCSKASFGTPKAAAPFISGRNQYSYGDIPGLQAALGPDEWAVYAVTKNQSTAALTWSESYRAVTTPAQLQDLKSNWIRVSPGWNTGAPVPAIDRPIVGIGIALKASWTNSGAMNYLPQQNSYGLVGVTDPEKCVFYWGEKIASTTDDRDEPVSGIAPMGEAPPGGGSADEPTDEPDAPESGDPCNFELTDPTTWASAGICALIDLITTIWNDFLEKIPGWLAAIVDPIVDAINALWDGLVGLFVPDEWPDWSALPSPLPDGWVPELPSLGGAGCGPLTFPQLQLGFNGATVGPVTFLSTCDEPWPLVRTLTYYSLLAGVLVGAVWGAYRAVAYGLGIGVSTGSAGGEDE